MKVWSRIAISVWSVSLVSVSIVWPHQPNVLTKSAGTTLPKTLPNFPWRVSHGQNPVDGSSITYISRGDGSSGGIVLGCNRHRLDVYLASTDTGFFDYNSAQRQDVSVKFGNKPVVRQRWVVSALSDGLFAPGPLPFVKSLIDERNLVIGYRVDGDTEMHSVEANDSAKQVEENCPAYAYSLRHAEKQHYSPATPLKALNQ